MISRDLARRERAWVCHARLEGRGGRSSRGDIELARHELVALGNGEAKYIADRGTV